MPHRVLGWLMCVACCLIVALLAPSAFAQVDDEIFGPDDGTDAMLRALIEAAPTLDAERIEVTLSPALAGDADGNLRWSTSSRPPATGC